MLNHTLKNLLLEISLQDHFKSYGERFGFTNEDDWRFYHKIANFDPTSRGGSIKGKYTEWLLKITKDIPIKDRFTLLDKVSNLSELLQDYSKISNVDINKFKTLEDFISYMDEFGGVVSEREKKQKVKEIFNDEKNIDVIDVTDEWIIAQPLTWEGSKKLACYKVSKGANWCTARSESSEHWEEYTETKSGSLFIIINKLNPLERYQIFQKHNGLIGEAMDYNNEAITYAKAYELIWLSDKLRKNYLDLDEADRAMQVELGIHDYKNHGDGTVSVDGNVAIRRSYMTHLPVKFKRVFGAFTLSYLSKLETLEGCPEYCSSFKVEYCGVKTLEGGPKRVKENYEVEWCYLESLKGCPEVVPTVFSVLFCENLNQLDYAPQGDSKLFQIEYCGKYFRERPEEGWREKLENMGCIADKVYIS